MQTGHGRLVVRRSERDLDIENGGVMLRLVFRDGGYAQEFHAADRHGEFQLVLSSIHKNLIHASQHRACSSPMIAGERPHLFGVCRESLRMVYSEARIAEQDDDRVVIALSGAVQGHSLTCEIEVRRDSDTVSVTVEDNVAHNGHGPVIEYLMSSFAFVPQGRLMLDSDRLDYAWAPNLRPANDHVIGDAAFHSPAVMVQNGHFAAALIADVQTLRANRPMPAALDLDLDNGLLTAPLLSYGFCDYEPADGCFRHDITMARRLPTPTLRYGFDLILSATCAKHEIARRVARELWRKAESGERKAEGDAAIPHSALRIPHSPDDHLSTVEQSLRFVRLLKHASVDAHALNAMRRYADFLIETRLRSGAIPSYYTREHAPLSTLRSSAQTAASVLFLGELARVTGTKKHKEAAERSGRFLLREIVPARDFQDYTLFDPTRCVSFDCPDPHTGMRPLGAWSLLWTAQAFLELHKLIGDHAYQHACASLLDELCLLQAHFDLPWREDCVPGACAVGNLGPHFDAEFTAGFALCALGFGAALGSEEHFRRGAAALGAVARMPCDGELRSQILADTAAANAELGSVYVHVGGRWGAELPGCHIEELTLSRGSIELQAAGALERVVFGGVRGHSYRLRINSRELTCSREEMERGVSLSGQGCPDTSAAQDVSGRPRPETQPSPVQKKLFSSV